MTELALAAAAFLATHFVSSTPARAVLARAMGEKAYIGLYSLVAAITLVWMAIAYGRATGDVLWSGPRWIPLVVTPFAFMYIVSGYWRNPTMIGADKLLKSDDPARGVIRITRHPLMWGVMLWAAAHMAVRGDTASLVFFGTFLVLGALGSVFLDMKKKNNPDWARFAALTSHVPFVAIAQGRNRIVWREIGWLRPGIGLAAFAGFFLAHAWVFGARPY